MAIAIVRKSDGRVQTFVREDAPDGWTPPEGFEAIPESELPDGWQMVEPEPTTEVESITPRQAKLALYGAGLLDTVEAMIAEADRVVQIHYHEATAWYRNDPVLAGLAAALGLSSEQLDDLFLQASKL
jgi:hypothetical protein